MLSAHELPPVIVFRHIDVVTINDEREEMKVALKVLPVVLFGLFAASLHAGGTRTWVKLAAQFIEFEETGSNEINHELSLEGNSRIHFQSEFNGSGRIINKKGSAMHIPEGAEMPLTLRNEGELKLGGEFWSSRLDAGDYDQNTTGTLQMRLRGDELGQSDRIIVTGMADLAGSLQLLIGEEYDVVPYVDHSLIQAGWRDRSVCESGQQLVRRELRSDDGQCDICSAGGY